MSWQHSNRVLRMRGLVPNVLSSIFVELDMNNASGVFGRYMVSELDGMRVVRSKTQGGRFQVLRSDLHVRRTSSHAVFICLPLSGELILRQHGRESQILKGDLGLLDSRAEYAIDVFDRADVLWLSLSPTQFDARLRELPDIVARRIDGSIGIGMIASKFVQSVALEIDSLTNPRATPFSLMMIDLVSAATSVGGASFSFHQSKASRKTWERACDYVERHLGDDGLSPTKIASAIGISTRYLSELFSSEEQTPMGWVMRRRLESCKMALEGQPWMPGIVTNIAFQYGFNNIPSFNRAFRRAFGRSPKCFMLARES